MPPVAPGHESPGPARSPYDSVVVDPHAVLAQPAPDQGALAANFARHARDIARVAREQAPSAPRAWGGCGAASAAGRASTRAAISRGRCSSSIGARRHWRAPGRPPAPSELAHVALPGVEEERQIRLGLETRPRPRPETARSEPPMSSMRSRSGGRWMGAAPRRATMSYAQPDVAAPAIARLVAAMMRTSRAPRRVARASSSRSCRKRRILICAVGRHLADLVEEQRAALGFLDQAWLGRWRASARRARSRTARSRPARAGWRRS